MKKNWHAFVGISAIVRAKHSGHVIVAVVIAIVMWAQRTASRDPFGCAGVSFSEMDEAVLDQLRAAADALGAGDPGPFASLLADDAEWRGISRGHLWWRQTPS